MTQIHLQAETGDYAAVVLLPGDPNRATRIAERFDGGLEASRLVNSNRGMLGYTGAVDGVPVSVQTTMMGAPTTSIVLEELLNLGATTFIRVGTCGGFGALDIGDVVVALAAASASGIGEVLGGGEPTAPTASFDVVEALARASRAQGLTTHVGPIVTSDVFYDPHPDGVVRWGRRGYVAVEMETAAIYLLAMRERARGRDVRAGHDPHGVGRDPRSGRGRGDPQARHRGLVPPAGGRGGPPRRPDDRRGTRGRGEAGPRLGHEREAELEVVEQVVDVLTADRQADDPAVLRPRIDQRVHVAEADADVA